MCENGAVEVEVSSYFVTFSICHFVTSFSNASTSGVLEGHGTDS